MRRCFAEPQHDSQKGLIMYLPPRARPIETIERLRWGLPVLIVLFVVVHQLAEVLWVDPAGPLPRFAAGVLVYGLIGPLVTWWVLTWIGQNLRQPEMIE